MTSSQKALIMAILACLTLIAVVRDLTPDKNIPPPPHTIVAPPDTSATIPHVKMLPPSPDEGAP